MIPIRDAFYTRNGDLFFDGRYRNEISPEKLNVLLDCIQDNFDGKKIDYEQAEADFEEAEK